MIIKGYLQTSVIEWPGKISCVIFTSGCNFRCGFCYNADLVEPGSTRLPLIREEQILTDLVKRKKWVDAVVVTGGEPTLQPDLEEFLKKVKQMGFLTMIETNGSNSEIIASLLHGSIIDRIAMDIKGPFERYDQIINFQLPIFNIKKSIELILKSGVEYEFRTTVVPGIHNKEVLKKMAMQLRREGKRARGQEGEEIVWKLQNFQPKNCLDPEFNKVKPFTEEEMEGFNKIINSNIEIRNPKQ